MKQGRISVRRSVGIAVVLSLGLLIGGVADGNTVFSLTFGSGLTGNQTARDAFQAAADRWSAILRDPVTVNLFVDYQSLGANILGETSTTPLSYSYDTIRNDLAGGGEGKSYETALLPNLPTSAQLQVTLPKNFSVSDNMEITSANWKALGETTTATSDGSITFSSNFSWDFDPSNGITSGKYDFVGVATHEMGHVLGFFSAEDTVDLAMHEHKKGAVELLPLDLFRFNTDDLVGGFNFTTANRDLTPGVSQSFYDYDNSVLMSTGEYNGDGYQASHWKEQVPSLGIMDPAAASGEPLSIGINDRTALDLIGWDVAPAPEPATMLLVGTGVLGVVGWLRRRAVR